MATAQLQPQRTWPRYAMSAYDRDGHLLNRATFSQQPTELQRRQFRSQFPQTQREWTSFSIEIVL